MNIPKLLQRLLGVMIVSITTHAENYVNPVIPGDYPDPSIVKVGSDFYVTATTSEWAPIFPILHSRDLVNWANVGAVFEKRPEWSVGSYWAPEIHEYKGKFFLYYVARKKDGPLSIAVATADKPTGPYTDHGPFISQPAGSIDPVAVDDENGKRYLIWKEDGNSRKEPTVLWIQALTADGLRVEGEKKEIIRNDLPWEGNVVEGPFVIRAHGYFYLIYAANACCGNACHYGVGVARAKNLLGPWEKDTRNVLVQENELWKCPGHGSIVKLDNGDFYFIYHAYNAKDSVFVGREAVLAKVDFDSEKWPVINGGKGTPVKAFSPFDVPARHAQYHFEDDFDGKSLDPNWQWPQNKHLSAKLDGSGTLQLQPDAPNPEEFIGAVLALKTASGKYQADVVLKRNENTKGHAGLSAFGDLANALGISIKNDKVELWRKSKNNLEHLAHEDLPPGETIHLRMIASGGHTFKFSYSTDGKEWSDLGQKEPLQGQYLPPWDRGVRIALIAGGPNDYNAEFKSFEARFTPPDGIQQAIEQQQLRK